MCQYPFQSGRASERREGQNVIVASFFFFFCMCVYLTQILSCSLNWRSRREDEEEAEDEEL